MWNLGGDEKRALEEVQRSIVISLLSDNDIIAYRHRACIYISPFENSLVGRTNIFRVGNRDKKIIISRFI